LSPASSDFNGNTASDRAVVVDDDAGRGRQYHTAPIAPAINTAASTAAPMRDDGRGGRGGGSARWILGVFRGQNLQRDVAIEPRVMRPIHLAHSAFADLGEDLVRAKRLAGVQSRIRY
jgi:hypothetical protein